MSILEQKKYSTSVFRVNSAINLQPGSNPQVGTPAERFYGDFHRNYVSNLTETLTKINIEQFATAVNLLAGTAGKTQILTMGNGGSGTIADHMAHNLNWDASNQMRAGQKLSARCLNTEASEITARGNDRNQAFVFATQLENHAHVGDVIVALSGSGNSDNIVKALDRAKDMGITTIFIGPPNSKSGERATLTIPIVSDDQQIVEDATHVTMHMFIRALKVRLGGLDQKALSEDVASLRTKSSGVESLSSQLGLPTEVAAFIENGFRTALGKLATRKIETAAQLVFDPLRRDALQTTALGNEFTSFTRLVSYADKNAVAKVAFGKTLIEMMQEFAKHGASGLVDVSIFLIQ